MQRIPRALSHHCDHNMMMSLRPRVPSQQSIASDCINIITTLHHYTTNLGPLAKGAASTALLDNDSATSVLMARAPPAPLWLWRGAVFPVMKASDGERRARKELRRRNFMVVLWWLGEVERGRRGIEEEPSLTSSTWTWQIFFD